VSGRRLLVLLAVLAAIAVPAGVLRALCVGNTCGGTTEAEGRIPFCSLREGLRDRIANGFREGRSPDVLAVASDTAVFTESGGVRLPWPATGTLTDARVPLVFAGAGVAPGTRLPVGITLDRVAPTVSELIGLERPFPEVRSGTAIEGVATAPSSTGDAGRPRLLLLVAWKGIGSAELEDLPDDWPFLASLMEEGAGTLEAETGSVPLDPAATMATIGTGGLPSQHGITGAVVRSEEGDVVPTFGPDSPVHVIATLADDLEEAEPRTLVGLVGTEDPDRGLVGGGWYEDQDPVDVVLGDPAAAPLAARTHLATGYGGDGRTDVLGVALRGGVTKLDRWTRRIVAAASEAAGGDLVVVVAGTGTWERSRLAVPAGQAVAQVEADVPGARPVVAAEVAGGLFLDQTVLTEQAVTGQTVVDALLAAETPGGETMFADAFQGFAVSFARYC
jgi:Type I phosphodiesterase / nucleotide pyrophosphatase